LEKTIILYWSWWKNRATGS